MHHFIRPSALAATAGTVLALVTVPTVASAVEPSTVVINEFSVSHAGTDTAEYIELLTPAAITDLSGYSVLQIEGDAPGTGVLDSVTMFPAPDADGRSVTPLLTNAFENGAVSLLLVTGTVPATGTDLDADNDGALDGGLGFTVVDAIAVNTGGTGALTYGGVTLGVAYDGLPFAPGGASRIADGTDTDSTSDWVRNDFDLAGIPGVAGTLVTGEAANTPGAANSLTVPPVVPPSGDADCDFEVVTIGSVQGAGAASPVNGATVRIEGTVVGDFQAAGGFRGYYVQDAGDGDAATSDGIFVFAPDGVEVSVGDVVNVAGPVSEFGGMTELTLGDVDVCATGTALPAATALTLPASAETREAHEGMYVTLPQSLAILEYFAFGQFGTIDVGQGRQYQPTALYAPGSPEAVALAQANEAERITIDDGRGIQNPEPAYHPNGAAFSQANSFRGGDLVTNATGILDFRFSTWAIQPTAAADFEVANPRPAVPDVGGDITVSSFNVLNYFTTLDVDAPGVDARGANTAEEFERQEAKIVSALTAIDADVFGLMEIENNGTAVEALTDALNEHLKADVYDYIDTGKIGTDAIATALIYKPATVSPVGSFQLMTEEEDPRWLDDLNRPGLTQTFADADGGLVTVVVNHLKSKSSACDAVGDPNTGDGSGNCNGTRTRAAAALADWLATDPTGQGAGRELIIGDLNAYTKEAPIAALTDAGFTDLLGLYEGPDAYSYVFDGQLGHLDHALAGTGLVGDVTGASSWAINADEPSIFDYQMEFKSPEQLAMYQPDPYASSDHDPVLVGLDLTPPDTTAPKISAIAVPPIILLPNGKDRSVRVYVSASDDRGAVTVALTDVDAIGKKAAVEQVDDRTFRVRAVNGARYVFTYTATDAAGNTATDTATVIVGLKGLLSPS